MSSYDDWIGRNVPESIMEDAAAWMALLDSESCTPADRITFAQWLGEDPQHQAAFQELAEVWAKLHVLADLQPLEEQPNVVAFPQREYRNLMQTGKRTGPSDWPVLLAAAVFMIGVGLHALNSTPAELLATDIGEMQTTPLADGSTVALNARSSVYVRFDDRQREIRMQDGEAFFSVAHDSRPFVVRTGMATVSAVGTEFVIASTPERTTISVVDGLVSVSANPVGSPLTEYGSSTLGRFSDEIALLGAGQQLELTAERRQFSALSQRQIIEEMSWRNGQMTFDETPLIAVLAEMRRYFRTNVLVADSRLNSLRISGRFPTGDAAPLLHYLEQEFGLIVDMSAGSHIVLRLPLGTY